MALFLAQVSFERDSGLPEDRVVNTFHMTGADAAAAGEDIKAALARFYDTASTANKISDFMSAELAGGALVKIYDMADASPRVPVYAGTFSVDVSSTALPAEVAVCLSYRAPLASGVDPARRRGRIFIGPLSTGAASGNPARPAATMIACMAASAVRLADELNTAAFTWVVYSAAAAASVPITDGWIDNAFDTMRKRGEVATARTEWTVA